MSAQISPAQRKVLSLKRPVSAPAKPAKKQPTPPLTPDERQRRKSRKIRLALDILFNAYPKVFGAARVPLAIGVERRLFEQIELGRLNMTKAMVRAALANRARSTAYLELLSAGGPRYDLRGEPEGKVTAEQQRDAQIRLAEKLERIARLNACVAAPGTAG